MLANRKNKILEHVGRPYFALFALHHYHEEQCRTSYPLKVFVSAYSSVQH